MKHINLRDEKLLQALRNNARMSLTKMSRLTKIPVSTLFDRLKAHEKSIILKHTTLLDFSQLGFDTKAQFLIKTENAKREQFKHYLRSLANVNSIYRLSNGFDFLVEGVFASTREVDEFKKTLENSFAIECNTHFVAEDVMREGFYAKSQ